MDVHLPDVDGLTLVQQLQAHEQYGQFGDCSNSYGDENDRSLPRCWAIDYI